MQETWVQSLGWEGALEKEMVTHASVLTWTAVRLSSVSDDRGETAIPWTEEPGGLQCMGLQRVRHD